MDNDDRLGGIMRGMTQPPKRTDVTDAPPPQLNRRVILDKIMNKMEKQVEPKEDTRPAYDDKRVLLPKESNIGRREKFPPGIIKSLQTMMSSSRSNVEIELAVGSFVNGNFRPGLFSITEFNSLKRKLTELTTKGGGTMVLKTYHDKVETMEGDKNAPRIRKITDFDTGSVVFENKIRYYKDNIDNDEWGYRISKSDEKFESDAPKNFSPNVIRERRRYSFTDLNRTNPVYGIKFDLAIIKETHLPKKSGEEARTFIKFEVELERDKAVAATQTIKVDAFIEGFEMVLEYTQNIIDVDSIINLPERAYASGYHNALFSNEMKARGLHFDNPYFLFKDYWNKPENIKIPDMIDPKMDWATTIKLDGIRNFCLITEKGIYLIMPPHDLRRVGDGNKQYTGTLLDGELYEDTYYIFDVLFFKGQDVRNSSLIERYKILNVFKKKLAVEPVNVAGLAPQGGDVEPGTTTAVLKKSTAPKTSARRLAEMRKRAPQIVSSDDIFYEALGIDVKNFYTKGDLYKKTNSVADEAGELRDKGIRFDGFIFQAFGPYKNNTSKKWKFPQYLTLDFYVKKVTTDTYNLCVGRNRDVFMGTPRYPFDGVTAIMGGVFEGEPVEDRIIEFTWNDNLKTFEPYKYRDDRDEPNAMATATDVWEDMRKPITIQTMRGNTLQTMRFYHNLEKATILNREFKEGDTIMDWGSGRLGDKKKWEKAKLKKVYAVEPDVDNIKIMKERLAQDDAPNAKPKNANTKPKHKVELEIVNGGAQETEKLIGVIEKDGAKLNGIVAFFSLTYLSKDSETYNGLVESLDALMTEGTKFVGIVMDGAKVQELLDKARLENKTPVEEAAEYATNSFSIAQATDFTDSNVGNMIVTNIIDPDSMVKDQEEFLFYFGPFITDLESRGIRLVKTAFIDHGPTFDTLPVDSKTFSSLNRAFVFERKGPRTRAVKTGQTKYDTLAPISSPYVGQKLGVIGVSLGNSNFIHAVVRAFDTKYQSMSMDEREKYVLSVRKVLSSSVTEKKFDTIDGGKLSKELTSKSLGKVANKDKSVAKEIAFLEFKLRLMDSTVFISGASASELLSSLLSINIYVLNTKGDPILSYTTQCDRKHSKNIILSYDGRYYNLIGRENENGEVFTIFGSGDPLILAIRGRLCK